MNKYLTTFKIYFITQIKKEDIKKYGEIIKFNPIKATLSVDRKKVKDSASKILKDLPVDDLDIQETPIQDIIANIFDK